MYVELICKTIDQRQDKAECYSQVNLILQSFNCCNTFETFEAANFRMIITNLELNLLCSQFKESNRKDKNWTTLKSSGSIFDAWYMIHNIYARIY